jgi:hypothetical protein
VKNKPLRSVQVGARIRLLPDDKVRLKHNDYQCNPNSSLGLPFDVDLIVEEIMVTDGMVLLRVNDTFKFLDMKRFTAMDWRAQ